MSSNTFVICTRCLGDSRFIKMTKHENGEECKQCTRPFTVYKFRNQSISSKPLNTIICETCAKARGSCQICLLDMEYGIPIELRDTALKMAGLDPISILKTSKNREVKAIMADKLERSFEKKDSNDMKAKELLSKLAEKFKEQNTNSTNTTNTDVEKQATITSKSFKKLPFNNNLKSSKYPDLLSFFIFGFPSDLPQYVLSKYCSQFGQIKSINLNHSCRCGYITFEDRNSCEKFADFVNDNGLNENKNTAGLINIDNNFLMRVCYGKVKPLGKTNEEQKQLSLLVGKVMKQLAEKDLKFKDGN
ncbi:SLT11 [Candida pseudojiufengensis]|uniref:SLT11 n=1 Tax=Candida pseudojiufengensis TaxID=497109 RepID=UPI0022255F52|nr:SLT11 [Candida pseudojiufengensis]KAI5960081.1 SLT11 [Candida pseudojiufengensis]